MTKEFVEKNEAIKRRSIVVVVGQPRGEEGLLEGKREIMSWLLRCCVLQKGDAEAVGGRKCAAMRFLLIHKAG